ncbi:MAG TPA: C4-dicarboxylate ABC transporter permease, partial [Ruminococcaceae bacterium]|nr:C4-dicarboxylate ABC transporter permease [Oscillospiraceae bacterium]
SSFGKKGVKSISIIVWVPILMCIICLIQGRKYLPKSGKGWISLLKETQGNIATVGGIFLFALAGSNVLSKVGFGDDLNALIQNLSLPKAAVVFLIGIVVALVAGPLSGVATTVAMGPVTYSVLTGIGVSPIAAVAAFLIWMSTEGASPPSSSPIFMSCGLAGVEDVQKTFKPLIFHYVIPVVCIGALIALGILPIAK